MSLSTTKAIVISSLKYSDSSLIVRLYTLEKGLTSFLLKGILASKKGKLKAAYFLPLTQLQIVASIKSNRNLHSIREATVINHYSSLNQDIVKQSIVLFLSEILSNSIKEEEENSGLYQFLETSFLWLDTHDKVSNFHLFFLLQLTKYLGFYPDVSLIDFQGFNLLEGEFTNSAIGNHTIRGEKLISFKKLLGTNFDALEHISFSKKERTELLQTLTHYYELHLDGFKHPRSLNVLETVFGR